MLQGTNLPLIILLISIVEIAILFNQWTAYLSRPQERKRLYHLMLLFFLISYNVAEGFFPDHRITFVPVVVQNFLGYGFGYVFASICPYYFYKTMGLQTLKFHGRFGFYFVIVPTLFFYFIVFPINNDISFTRKFVYIIPGIYAISLFYSAIRSSIKDYKINLDRYLLNERILIFFAVFPVSVIPIFGGWLGVDKWIITTTFNLGFLVVNSIFMHQLVRQSKSEFDMLTDLKNLKTEINSNARISLERNCSVYGLTKRETEILFLIVDGYEYKKVADNLFISERTVNKHVQNIFSKVGVSNKTKLINTLINSRVDYNSKN